MSFTDTIRSLTSRYSKTKLQDSSFVSKAADFFETNVIKKQLHPPVRRKRNSYDSNMPAYCLFYFVRSALETDETLTQVEKLTLLKFIKTETDNCLDLVLVPSPHPTSVEKLCEEYLKNIIDNIRKQGESTIKQKIDNIYTSYEKAQLKNQLFSVSVSAIRGRRRTMEDTHICMPYFDLIFSNDENSNENLHLYAVFDGHGGPAASQFSCIEYPFILAETLSCTSDIKTALNKALTTLNIRFKNRARDDSGSTAAIVLHNSTKNQVHSSWVGDSESFVLTSDSTFMRLVFPHKLEDPAEIKRIENAGGRVVFYPSADMVPRLNGNLAVARAIGDADEVGLECIPDYQFETIAVSKKSFLVIACDGLWDVALPQNCMNVLNCFYKEMKGFEAKAAKSLTSYAYGNYSTDNISVIVVDLSPDFPNSVEKPDTSKPESISDGMIIGKSVPLNEKDVFPNARVAKIVTSHKK